MLETSLREITSKQSLYSGKNNHYNDNLGPIAIGGHKVLYLAIYFSIAKFSNVVVNQVFKEVHKEIHKE
jgi:hypothetical protein